MSKALGTSYKEAVRAALKHFLLKAEENLPFQNEKTRMKGTIKAHLEKINKSMDLNTLIPGGVFIVN